MTAVQITARNADLATIKTVLEDQRARRLDLITTAANFRATDRGTILVTDGATIMDDEGVTSVGGEYVPTETFDRRIAGRLGIAERYLINLRAEDRGDMWAANINGKAHGNPYLAAVPAEFMPPLMAAPDPRKHMLRLLRGDDATSGVARAFLSPKYKIMDSLDVLLATLKGVRASGVDAFPAVADLSDSRFYMTLEAPEISALAPRLLEGYRNPFDGPNARQRADANGAGLTLSTETGSWAAARATMLSRYGEREVGNAVWAGLVVSNSDTGEGARFIAPMIRVLVCRNGMTITRIADRKVHLGAERQEGVVDWSTETLEAELALITSQVTDAVKGFLTPEFLAEEVNKIEVVAGAPVLAPETAIKAVAKTCGFTKAEADDILGFFVQGGQGTAGGVANAVTAYAQTIDSADRAYELGLKAIPAMEAAAKL